MYYNGVIILPGQEIQLGDLQINLRGLATTREVQSGYDYLDWPVIMLKDGLPKPIFAEWGMVPAHVKHRRQLDSIRKGNYMTANVHSRMLLTHKNYRDSALNNRCLVLSSHFFDFRYTRLGESEKLTNIPYCIGLKHQPLFCMAGIARTWTDKLTDITSDFFAVVVTDAGEFMGRFNNPKKSQPTLLPAELALEWLTGKLAEHRIQEISQYQLPSEQMMAYPVAREYRKSDQPLVPTHYEGLMPL